MAVAGVLREARSDRGRDVRRFVDVLTTAQHRFESSAFGEVLISALVGLILVVAVVSSMPDSAIRRTTLPTAETMTLATGLDQSWYMFAPDPFRRLETVEVRVTTAGGEERVWTVPHGNVLDQFSWYHWHKLKEQSVMNPRIRADLARWAGATMLGPDDYPAQVVMRLQTRPLQAPGLSHPRAERSEETVYSETMAGPP